MKYVPIMRLIFFLVLICVGSTHVFGFQSLLPQLRAGQATVLAPDTVRFEAAFTHDELPMTCWFRWWTAGASDYSERLFAETDSAVEGIRYVSCLATGFSPSVTYRFRAYAGSPADTSYGEIFSFMTQHSNIGRLTVDAEGPNSFTIHLVYNPAGVRSVIRTAYRYIYLNTFQGVLAIDTVEGVNTDVQISHVVSDLTPSSRYYVSAEVMSVDETFATSASLTTARTQYDSTARGLMTPLFISYAFNAETFAGIVNFGVHTSGSSCIDPLLGEMELPPWPPLTAAEARIIGSCLNLGSYHDFHEYISPAQIDTYRVRFQPENDTYPVYLSWPDLHGSYSGPVTLVTPDTILDMMSTTSYAVEESYVNLVRIIAKGPLLLPYAPEIADRVAKLKANSPYLFSTIITNGLPTEAWFEWGTDGSFGQQTSHRMLDPDQMTSVFWDSIPGLGQDTTYYLRTVAKNSHGTFHGSAQPVAYSLTDVGPGGNAPSLFELNQNYPNPFNPATTFSFVVGSYSFVKLKVFDLLGREIATIVKENMRPGEYSRKWNAANISSGMYFYSLQAGSFISVKKLMIVK